METMGKKRKQKIKKGSPHEFHQFFQYKIGFFQLMWFSPSQCVQKFQYFEFLKVLYALQALPMTPILCAKNDIISILIRLTWIKYRTKIIIQN